MALGVERPPSRTISLPNLLDGQRVQFSASVRAGAGMDPELAQAAAAFCRRAGVVEEQQQQCAEGVHSRAAEAAAAQRSEQLRAKPSTGMLRVA